MIRSTKIALAGAFAAGAVLTVCMAVAMPPADQSTNEPVAAPIHSGESVSPTPTPTPDPDPSPVTVTPTPEPVNEEPWLVADDGTQHFEDGSWLEADGTQGCTDGMPCSELPPVPVGEPTTPNGGYFPTLNLRPCLNEDSEDCYWDAARMGNGQGTSFIRLGGVTYYPDQPVTERRTVTLNGVTLDYVDGTDAILYCDLPLTVGIDEDDNGNQWAGCM